MYLRLRTDEKTPQKAGRKPIRKLITRDKSDWRVAKIGMKNKKTRKTRLKTKDEYENEVQKQ